MSKKRVKDMTKIEQINHKIHLKTTNIDVEEDPDDPMNYTVFDQNDKDISMWYNRANERFEIAVPSASFSDSSVRGYIDILWDYQKLVEIANDIHRLHRK